MGRMKDRIPLTYMLFDCRNYIKPGDSITFKSVHDCKDIDHIAVTYNYFISTAKVTKVYREFVEVKLNRITEHVNRWDILALNSKLVRSGAFERPYKFMDSVLSKEIMEADED